MAALQASRNAHIPPWLLRFRTGLRLALGCDLTISTPRNTRFAHLEFGASNEGGLFLLWERQLAAMIVAGSHSHKGDTSLPIGRRQRATTRLLRTHQFQETGSGARRIRLPLRAADPLLKQSFCCHMPES